MSMKLIRLACAMFVVAVSPVALAQDAAQIERGRAAYVVKGCYECHGYAGQGSTMSGPMLAGVPWTYEGIDAYIRAPKGQMPPYSKKILSAPDLQDIHAFIVSLKPRGGSTQTVAMTAPGYGAALFATHCAACHGADGGGKVGPSLIGAASRLGAGGVAHAIIAPPEKMPKLYPQPLGDSDVKAIATYVEAMK